MTSADNDLESAHSVHIGSGSAEKDAKVSSDDSKPVAKGTESTLDAVNEKAEAKESSAGPVAKQPEPTPEPVTKQEQGKPIVKPASPSA